MLIQSRIKADPSVRFSLLSYETPTAFSVSPNSLVYFLSSLTYSVGMWLSEREKERERRKGWKSAKQMNEHSAVWHRGREDCMESWDRRRKEEAGRRAGPALRRRGPLIKSEGQTWELTQASTTTSQWRRRGGSTAPPHIHPSHSLSVRPVGLLAPARDGGRAGRRQLVWLSV